MIEVRTSSITDDDLNKGVFAKQDIPKDELLHEAPVIPYPNEEHHHIEKTHLADYVFEYGEHHSAFLLGYGMMFNHSYQPNAYYEINFESGTFEFYAYTDIEEGEEVLINYNGEVDNETPLWFNEVSNEDNE
ncbi:SET domain-containing protein [Pontibacillus yanchengensis]|uniref:Lysine methyltransferase n=1 Tax=Pontibacillus yanchengensis Y32 TaxID=1385514 RepID=A0A0A2TH91_9BACI|nr:SET domain-containing protein [Pontibacillus yanchengensis]KGP73446.1 lysine methyltransferase [Pontibacillus yanchengensis Y32]